MYLAHVEEVHEGQHSIVPTRGRSFPDLLSHPMHDAAQLIENRRDVGRSLLDPTAERRIAIASHDDVVERQLGLEEPDQLPSAELRIGLKMQQRQFVGHRRRRYVRELILVRERNAS